MKAAHGSPPLAPRNRHHSNSSYDRMKACSASNSQAHRPNKRTIMPPFLRLDSTGEVISVGKARSVGHQRTNTCSQGASHSVTGGNGVLNKLITHLVPQVAPSSNLLNSPRDQNGFCALDDLLNRKQTLNGVTMAGKSSHVNMVQTNWPHLSRYGQWGAMCPDYSFLPRGVFPCHVFQARQLRDPSNMWGSTSGQFVFNFAPGMPVDSSLLHSWWKCSADSTNLPPPQKMNAASSVSMDNVPRGNDKACSVHNHTSDSSVNKLLCGRASGTRGPGRDILTGIQTQTNDIPQHSKMENLKEKYIAACLNPSKCIDSSLNLNPSAGNQNKCNMSQVTETCVSVSKEVPAKVVAEKHDKKTETDDSDENEFQAVDIAIQATDLEEGEMFFHPQCEGAECMDLLRERHFYSPQSDCDCPDSHSVTFRCLWGRVQVQSAIAEEATFDSEDDEDDQNPDNTQSQPKESEEIWKCFISSRFCLSNLLSASSNKQPSEEELNSDEAEEKQCAPKPCPAVTERWLQFYSSVPSVAEHPCKVRFKCGEGKDIVHEYEKGEEETFTVMEIQKTRDLNRQHGKNAASLLQKRCANDEPDGDADLTEGDQSMGSDSGLQGEQKKKAETYQYVFAVNVGLVLEEEDSDSDDSDCEDSDSEEDDPCDPEDEGDAGDGSDDDFIVFEDE